ncbi:MAG: S1C family serine protease [Peptococcaceae bacterium]
MEEYEIVTIDDQQEEHYVEEYISAKEHKGKLRKTAVMSFMAAIILMIGFGFGIYTSGFFSDDNKVAANFTTQQVSLETSGSSQAEQLTEQNSITKIVEKRGPAVVTIETESQQTWSGNDFYSRLFRAEDLPQQRIEGLGSGFIISSDGYLLTNYHVIEGAETIKVRLMEPADTYDAEIIGTDEKLDLAILKIAADKELPVIPLGNSDNISAGDWAIAIGNPYGLDHTVTMGVISAKERPLTVDGNNFESLLQTDASINPGNSGGPLLNLAGEVIGINTAINAEGQGLGFAIPINTVQEVLQDLLTKGKVSRPWLGVSLLDLTPQLADYLRTRYKDGVVIADVSSGGPAEKAGLQQGDIILEINNQKITASNEVVDIIDSLEIGAKVEISAARDNSVKNFSIVIAER